MMHQGELFTARSSRRQDVDGFPHRMAMPAIRRTSIVPSQIDRHPLRRWWRRVRFGATATTSPSHDTHGVAPGWRRQARRRRIGLALLILVQTALAAWLLGHTFPYSGLSALEAATLGVFAVLWVWISLGFWTAVAGFVVTWTNATRVVRDTATGDDGRPLRSRTAILVPIYNEDVRRVFAGVEATYRSLAATGYLDAFDFYVLSDTRDGATRHAEARAWDDTCRAVDGFGRLFYRHRRNNIKRKSGNIADFLRRWGRNYDYMIVFDADTVMAGSSLVRLVRLMEERPRAGIIQTIPAMVNRETLFGRVQQFASRAYGPMLAAGLRYWQLGESYYWGHNAILRCEAFIRHCGLPRLPGQPPLGGEILSHDFVEAALMGRGGWEVWIECGVSGSYEETPPTLLDDLKRDRRWCQGNLQHVRLLFGDGIRFGHRAIMAMGVVAYVSALFWATFIVLSTVVVVEKWFSLPPYFASGPSLFPLWPQWRPELAVALLGTTAVLLLLPKILSVFVIARARQAVLFGSLAHLWASVALEIVFSTLLAPIRMWFHSKFVLFTLTGRQITWNAQCRDDNETRWSDAIREHGPAAGVALAGMLGLGALSWSLIWWVLPLVAALLLAGPLSVYSSRASIGRAVRRWGLFVTPEETDPPDVIRSLHDALERRSTKRARLEGTRRVDSSRVPRTDRAAA